MPITTLKISDFQFLISKSLLKKLIIVILSVAKDPFRWLTI